MSIHAACHGGTTFQRPISNIHRHILDERALAISPERALPLLRPVVLERGGDLLVVGFAVQFLQEIIGADLDKS
jgi:hypothetical protein